jgi:hypothetical protein
MTLGGSGALAGAWLHHRASVERRHVAGWQPLAGLPGAARGLGQVWTLLLLDPLRADAPLRAA